MKDFGLDIWADNNFMIQNDTVNVNYASNPSLLKLTQEIRWYMRHYQLEGEAQPNSSLSYK
jgi:hypothetical protein